MPETNRVTAGPWWIEPNPDDEFHAEINGAKGGTTNSEWYALAKVVVRMSDDDEDSPAGRANLNLIMSAVNACFQVSPTNPSAVAAEIGEAFALLNRAVAATCSSAGEDEKNSVAADYGALIRRIHSKSKGGGE